MPARVSGSDLKDLGDEHRIKRWYEQPPVVTQSKQLNGEKQSCQEALLSLCNSQTTGGRKRTMSEILNQKRQEKAAAVPAPPVIFPTNTQAQAQAPADTSQITLEELVGLPQEEAVINQNIEDEGFDVFNGGPESGLSMSEQLSLQRKPVATPQVPQSAQGIRHTQPAVPSKYDNFFAKKDRIQLSVHGGTLIIPVIKVIVTEECVTLIMNLEATDGYLFIPEAGSRLKVTYNNESHMCYYPGTYANITEGGFGILMMLKVTDEKVQCNEQTANT